MLEQKNCLNSKKLKQEDTKEIQKLEKLLNAEKSLPKLVSSNGEEIILPQPVYDILCDAVEAMANGVTITISPLDKNITTQEAADLLNVSHNYLTELLEQEKIPYTKVGTQNMINCRDIFAYKETKKDRGRETIQGLTSFLQEE